MALHSCPSAVLYYRAVITREVMNKVKDCREEDAILFFCNNCTDKGILNAISRREITCFADLASIV